MPSGRRPHRTPFGGGASPRGPLSFVVTRARNSVVRRTHQPFGCRKHRLVGTTFAPLQRHRHCGHPRSLFLGQCGGLDFGIGSWRRHSLPGELFGLVGTKIQAPSSGRKKRKQASKISSARTGLGAHGAQSPSRQIQSPFDGLPQIIGRGYQGERSSFGALYPFRTAPW